TVAVEVSSVTTAALPMPARWSVRRHGPLARPLPQRRDLLTHDLCERACARCLDEEHLRREELLCSEGRIQCRHDHLLELRAAEIDGRPRDRRQVEPGRVLVPSPEMQSEDLPAGRLIRKVDEEDLIE